MGWPTECYFPDPEEFNRRLEQFRQWAREQWRLKELDDRPSELA